MDERNVLITGASSDIGRAMAVQLAERGDTVVVAARRWDAPEDLVRLTKATLTAPKDITEAEQVAA